MKFKLSRQDYLFGLIIVLYLSFQISLLVDLKSLPSPLYGGDYYFSMGAVQHFISGGNPFASSNILGSEPGYLPLYTLLVGGIGIIIGASAFVSMKVFSVLLAVLSLLVMYSFGKKLFKDKGISIICVLLYIPLLAFPVWKYRQFTAVLMIPLFLLVLLWFFEKRNLLSAIALGLILGLLGISHTAAFALALIFFGLMSLYIVFLEREPLLARLKQNVPLLILIFLLGFFIALLYWYRPLFVHHMNMPEASLYSIDFSTFKLQAGFILSTLKDYYLNFSTIFHGIRSVLFILGIAGIFFVKRFVNRKFILFILLAAFIGGFHQLITEPLFGTSFSPIIVASFAFPILAALLGALFIDLVLNELNKHKEIIIIILIAALMTFSAQAYNQQNKSDQWLEVGRQELPEHLKAMKTWVMENTDVNDVFLSSNELSFALNGLTGRKLLVTRRAQNSPFIQMDLRQQAAAIILYGNIDTQRRELLKQYNIKYLYWDYYWLQSEFIFNEQGQIISWFDPLIVRDNPIMEESLNDYGIKYSKQYSWIDPAVHEPLSKENLLIIIPYQLDIEHPWNPELDSHLKEVWNYTINGQTISRIYEINIGKGDD